MKVNRNRRSLVTWKWGELTHLVSWLNRGTITWWNGKVIIVVQVRIKVIITILRNIKMLQTFWNSAGSITSRISSSSLRNMTSLGLCTLGQYLGDEVVMVSGEVGVVLKNKIPQQ